MNRKMTTPIKQEEQQIPEEEKAALSDFAGKFVKQWCPATFSATLMPAFFVAENGSALLVQGNRVVRRYMQMPSGLGGRLRGWQLVVKYPEGVASCGFGVPKMRVDPSSRRVELVMNVYASENLLRTLPVSSERLVASLCCPQPDSDATEIEDNDRPVSAAIRQEFANHFQPAAFDQHNSPL